VSESEKSVIGEPIPDVSDLSTAVLLAARDGEPWIEAQIQSILRQKSVSIHLFISVDPSADATRAICTRFADTYGNVTLVDEKPYSGGAACHFLQMLRELDLSAYAFVALSDQDDLWFGHKLERACERLHQAGAAGYSSNVIAFWPDGRKKLIRKDYPQRRWDYLFEAAGPGCTYVMTKTLVAGLQQFLRCHESPLKKVFLHDWFIYAYARSKGEVWIIDSIPSLLYRQHHANVIGANDGLQALRQRFCRLSSGWALQQAQQICSVLGVDQHPEIRSWYPSGRRTDWLGLALRAPFCRRRWRDQLAMIGICVYLFATKKGFPDQQ